MGSYRAVVIGVSVGGLDALLTVLPGLPQAFPLPVMIVYHRSHHTDDFLARHLNEHCCLQVREAQDKEPIVPGAVYLAPASYHLLVEQEKYLSLSVDPKVNHSQPAIDVLFDSAADAYGPSLIGIVMTGASGDGARGLARIVARGGLAIVQDPETAESELMPQMALEVVGNVNHVPTLNEMAPLLCRLVGVEAAPDAIPDGDGP